MSSSSATSIACANIALIKYWGKRNSSISADLNLPAVGSLSITLDALQTKTKVHFDPSLQADTAVINGQILHGKGLDRIQATLNRIRSCSDDNDLKGTFARVESQNNFPTAAGLASSASGFAALVHAANQAADLSLDDQTLSRLARQGSGSAARSLFGGYVLMHKGHLETGDDAYAEPLFPADHWPLEVVIAITDSGSKKVPSTDGMNQTANTSPYFKQWVDTSESDIETAIAAITARDFEKLADVSEYSCLKMHASALAAQPGTLYWNPATVACIHTIRTLRAAGHQVFFTIDAGPQVKAICSPEEVTAVSSALAQTAGVINLLHSSLGDPARHIA